MLAHLVTTLRFGLRSAWIWGVTALGLLLTWFVARHSVLALHHDPARQRVVAGASSGLFGAAVTLWILARLLAEDRGSGFALAADSCRAGTRARLFGRWGGACVAGALCALLICLGAAMLGPSDSGVSIWLYYTTTAQIALVGAWCLVLATWLPPIVAAGAAAALWFVGHLPWTHLGGMPRVMARALSAWLPRTSDGAGLAAESAGTVAAAGLTTAALLLIASSQAERSAAPRRWLRGHR